MSHSTYCIWSILTIKHNGMFPMVNWEVCQNRLTIKLCYPNRSCHNSERFISLNYNLWTRSFRYHCAIQWLRGIGINTKQYYNTSSHTNYDVPSENCQEDEGQIPNESNIMTWWRINQSWAFILTHKISTSAATTNWYRLFYWQW